MFALLVLGSVGMLANPATAILDDLLNIVHLDLPPLVTKVLTTTYPATTATSYTSGSTVYYWTPYPYPTSTSASTCPPDTTETVTETTTVPTTTTVTATTTVTEPCTPTFSCDKYGYLIQRATLFRVDLATGEFTTVKDIVGDNTPINAMGYNTRDNFLYARQSGANQLIRIAADGTAVPVATLPTTEEAYVGDIDTDGYYWYGNRGQTWHQLDLRPESASYGQLLSQGRADLLGLHILDWAYIPVGGPYLYSVARNADNTTTALARFSLDTKQWEAVRQYPRIAGNGWGAVYGINNGTLYGSDNAGGQIWAFPIDGGDPYLASQGPISGSNDGARCVLNLDLN
jgi:hypothetical protein